MNPHRPKKLASDEYTTDEEEIIVYDVEDEIESNPDYVKENVVLISSTSINIHRALIKVWKQHCFPSSWREAIVIPILKPGKVATDPLSYRLIALSSCFCKTFERMINTRLVCFGEREKCISPLQSGFRKG
ncbi:putative RNA-directed DNA polymerase from transposon BS [Trichonephila clavipes]|nr:putative RNA-directed DNA polymerase from transposon BS [Trichonephila clavipes]